MNLYQVCENQPGNIRVSYVRSFTSLDEARDFVDNDSRDLFIYEWR